MSLQICMTLFFRAQLIQYFTERFGCFSLHNERWAGPKQQFKNTFCVPQKKKTSYRFARIWGWINNYLLCVCVCVWYGLCVCGAGVVWCGVCVCVVAWCVWYGLCVCGAGVVCVCVCVCVCVVAWCVCVCVGDCFKTISCCLLIIICFLEEKKA